MNVQEMIDTMNKAIEYNKSCIENNLDNLLQGHQAEMRGMIRMLNIATGKTYKITEDGVKEA